MIYYQQITFESNGESFKYRLTKKKIFATGYNFGKWELRNPENEVVAKCDGSIVVAYPNYLWDGSTVIGEHYEDEVTLEASLIHDILYNAKKNPDDIKVKVSLFRADMIFRDYLRQNYRKKGNWFQKYIFPNLYMTGLWIGGLPWKFGNNKYYKLNKLA
jgi:hypothetical protein